MNKCVICGNPCNRTICPFCLDDFDGIDEPVIIRFLNASAGRDKVFEKKNKPIEEEDELNDSIQ